MHCPGMHAFTAVRMKDKGDGAGKRGFNYSREAMVNKKKSFLLWPKIVVVSVNYYKKK